MKAGEHKILSEAVCRIVGSTSEGIYCLTRKPPPARGGGSAYTGAWERDMASLAVAFFQALG